MMLTCEDKHGQLGIWDARARQDDAEDEDRGVDPDQRESGKYWRLQVHSPANALSSITCIKFDPIDAHSVSHKQPELVTRIHLCRPSLKVYTSAYDSTVRTLSFTSGILREVFTMDKVLITSMDVPPASHELWLSDAEGWVTHLDLREDKSKRRTYQLSDEMIKCLSVNPINPAFILTSSNNGVLK